jgi:hypothetical protein
MRQILSHLDFLEAAITPLETEARAAAAAVGERADPAQGCAG